MSLVKNSTRILKSLYRYTFEIVEEGKGTLVRHTLLVNPEEMNMEEPARTTVTQTLGGSYTTSFGRGLPKVTMSGTTGYRKTIKNGVETDGFEEFINLRKRVFRDFIEENNPKISMRWLNWEDNEFYEIEPLSFKLSRNKAQPLLYRYMLSFECVKRLYGINRTISADVVKDPTNKKMLYTISSSTSYISETTSGLN